MIEEYGKKGFEILCVTASPKSACEQYVADTKLAAPIAILNGGDLNSVMGGYKFNYYPSSVLVNPKGVVVWAGNPSGVDGKLIEEHIVGARTGKADGSLSIDAELPKKWASAAKSMAKGDIGRGLAAIDKALEDQGLDADSRDQLLKAQTEARDLFEAEWKQIETAGEEKRYFDAINGLETVAKHFKNHEFGDRAKDRLKELKGQKELRDEIEAGRRIASALEDIAAEKADKAEKTLKGLLGGPLKTTEEAKRAQKILDELSAAAK